MIACWNDYYDGYAGNFGDPWDDCAARGRKVALKNWLPYKATWAKQKAYMAQIKGWQMLVIKKAICYLLPFCRKLNISYQTQCILRKKDFVTAIYYLVNFSLLVSHQPSEKGHQTTQEMLKSSSGKWRWPRKHSAISKKPCKPTCTLTEWAIAFTN